MKNYSSSNGFSVKSRHSDLDWNGLSMSPKALRNRHKPGNAWECGDRQKVKHLASVFGKHATLHGVHYITSNNRKISRWKKIFIWLFLAWCLLSMIGSLIFLIQESWSAQSVFISSTMKDGVNGSTEDPLFPRYPAITFCRRPNYRIDTNSSDRELLEYAFLALGYPFTSLTPIERSRMIGITSFRKRHPERPLPQHLMPTYENLKLWKERYDELKKSDESFNLTQFILDNSPRYEDIFIQCILLVFDFECSKIFNPVLTGNGICYTINLDKVLSHFQVGDFSRELSLKFVLQAAPTLGKAVKIGYEVYISDPRNRDGLITVANSMMNGFMTVMKTKLIKVSREALFTPWHGLYSKCPTLSADIDPLGYEDRFFKIACDRHYLGKMILNKCGCRYPYDLYMEPEKVCEPVDVYGCFVGLALTDNLTGMNDVCGHPCIEYNYDTNVNFVKIGNDKISRLEFIYDGSQYTLDEYRTTTISSFLSKIGGALGLYVGASIISVVELVVFLATWLWYSCMPHKRTKTLESTGTLHSKANKDNFFS